MGRAGAGGSGGRHQSSGGGHRVSRVSGGHRIGGSSGSHSRAGSGSKTSSAKRSNMGSAGSMSSGGYTRRSTVRMRSGISGSPPPPPPRYREPRTYHSYGNYNGCSEGFVIGCTVAVFLAVVVVFFILVFRNSDLSLNYSMKSAIVRERLDTENAYINDCIIDELDWFKDTSNTSVQLKKFWEETGVQPYIILKSYDAALKTESQKEQWATDYYDANFDTENIFLYVYFAEEDTDNDVGYMAYANGFQTSTIMDAEAVNIFWNYLDRYWTSDMETDEVFVYTFNNTAKAIMYEATTGKELKQLITAMVSFLIFLAIVFTVVYIVKLISKHKKEKDKERERILNTPINDIVMENLEDKYLK